MYDSWAGGKVTEDSNSPCPACQSLPHSEPAALIYRFRATREGCERVFREKKKKVVRLLPDLLSELAHLSDG